MNMYSKMKHSFSLYTLALIGSVVISAVFIFFALEQQSFAQGFSVPECYSSESARQADLAAYPEFASQINAVGSCCQAGTTPCTVNGIRSCLTCQSGQYIDSTTCTCKNYCPQPGTGYASDERTRWDSWSSSCQCPSGKTSWYDSSANTIKCVDPCPTGQSRNASGQCVNNCPQPGTGLSPDERTRWDSWSSSCQCPQGKTPFFNSSGVTCLDTCPLGQERNASGQCVNICTRANETWSGSQCVCAQNYVRDVANGECVPVCHTCPGGETPVNGLCPCALSSQVWSSSLQQCVNRCPSPQNDPRTVWNGTSCTCPAGTQLYSVNTSVQSSGFVCATPCQSNETFNSETGQCQARCPVSVNDPRTSWNGSSCVCPGGVSYDASSQSCGLIPNSCPETTSTTAQCVAPSTGPGITTTRTYGSYPTCQETVTNSGYCTPPSTSAVLVVQSNLSRGGWVLQPGNFSGNGFSSTYTVTPSSSGSLYSLVPQQVSGYSVSVTNGEGGGSSLLVFPGQSRLFSLTYTSSTATTTSDFSVGAGPLVQAPQGSSAQHPILARRISGNNIPITFSVVSGLPLGVSVTWSNQGCTTDCNAVLTMNIADSVPAGDYSVTVSGSYGSLSRSTTFTLRISGANGLSVTCSANPTSTDVGSPVVWSSSVRGAQGEIVYRWSGSEISTTPAPSGAEHTQIYSTPGAKTATVTVQDEGGAGRTATCATRVVQVGVRPVFQEF